MDMDWIDAKRQELLDRMEARRNMWQAESARRMQRLRLALEIPLTGIAWPDVNVMVQGLEQLLQRLLAAGGRSLMPLDVYDILALTHNRNWDAMPGIARDPLLCRLVVLGSDGQRHYLLVTTSGEVIDEDQSPDDPRRTVLRDQLLDNWRQSNPPSPPPASRSTDSGQPLLH